MHSSPSRPASPALSNTQGRGLAVTLAVVVLALHLPFLPRSLEDLDSINFALGVRHFDVAQHQPHPPGYPVYVAAAKIAHAVVPDESRVLSLISVLAGALGVWSLIALFTRLDVSRSRREATVAALLAATCPLFWLTMSRPLSDVPGLAAALALQALILSASGRRTVIAASFLTGLAIGIRLQVAWLTVPLLAWSVVRRRSDFRVPVALPAAAFAAGCAVWAVPLVAISGGPSAYWRAFAAQGTEDLTGVEMLWTRPTPRELIRGLYFGFVAPWAIWPIALPVLLFAAAGVRSVYRTSPSTLGTIALAFGPYLAFDLLFQEPFTTRYALPLVPPVAYLAIRAVAMLPRRTGLLVGTGAIGLSAAVAIVSLREYAALEAPAFRMLEDMRVAGIARQSQAQPVLAMHRREDFDLRRPILWKGADLPAFSRRLAAPPKHEWLELARYWKDSDGSVPVWFVADPQRTDLALVDRRTAGHRVYRWPVDDAILLGGVRPNEMDWYVFDSPGWYLGEGWALTPEAAGVAEEDHRGPGIAPIEGWIRRRSTPMTLMVGGRNLGGEPSNLELAVDGKPVGLLSVPPGFFLRFVDLPEGAIAGARAYAHLAVSARAPSGGESRVAVEQFDAQPANVLAFGFGEGWHEMEYNPVTGRSWRWVGEQGVIRVRGAQGALMLAIAGDAGGAFDRTTTVSIRVGNRAIGRWGVRDQFAIQTAIPADALPADRSAETAIVVESDRYIVPAERSRRTQDRRHLALRVDDVRLTAAF